MKGLEGLAQDLKGMEKAKTDKTPTMVMVCSQAFLLIYIMNMLSVFTGFFAVNNF